MLAEAERVGREVMTAELGKIGQALDASKIEADRVFADLAGRIGEAVKLVPPIAVSELARVLPAIDAATAGMNG
jgi:hypothetical protein